MLALVSGKCQNSNMKNTLHKKKPLLLAKNLNKNLGETSSKIKSLIQQYANARVTYLEALNKAEKNRNAVRVVELAKELRSFNVKLPLNSANPEKIGLGTPVNNWLIGDLRVFGIINGNGSV
jgi:hypothetical protein